MSIAVYVIALAFILALALGLEWLFGFKRGFIKSSVSLGVVIICVALAILLSVCIAGAFSGSILDLVRNVLGEGSDTVKKLDELNNIMPSLDSTLNSYIAMLLAPILFILLFYILRGIFAIASLILYKTVFTKLPDDPKAPKKDDDIFIKKKTRLLGSIVGVVTGLIITVCVTAPFIGTIKVADAALNNIELESEDGSNGLNNAKTFINDCSENGFGNVLYSCGGKAVYNALSTSKINGKKVTLYNDVSEICGVVGEVMYVAPAFENPDEITDGQIDRMNTLGDKFGNSETLKVLLSEFLSGASRSWLKGEQVLGMDKPSLGEIIDPSVDAVLDIFKTSDVDNIQGDVSTIFRVIAKLAKSGVLGDTQEFDKLLEKLSSSGSIREIVIELGENRRMSVLVGEISNLGIRALASTLGIPADMNEQYNKLMNDIAENFDGLENLSPEDAKALLSQKLGGQFDEYGIDVPEDVALDLAGAMLDDLGNGGEINSDAVMEFFKVYAASSAVEVPGNVSENVITPEIQFLADTKENTITFDAEGHAVLPDGTVLKYYTVDNIYNSGAMNLQSDVEALAGLAAADKMVSCVMTLSDLLSMGDLDPADAAAEADVLSAMVDKASQLASIVAKDNYEFSEVIGVLGDMMDIMSNSKLLGGDSAGNMLTAILQSSAVADSTGLSKKEAFDLSGAIKESAKEDASSFKTVLVSVSDAVTVIQSVNDENLTDEEREKKVTELINNLTPASARALEQMSTASMMIKYDVPEENAQASADFIGSLFNNMADYNVDHKDDPNANYDREAKSVNRLFHTALNGRDGKYEYAFNDAESGRSGNLNDTAYGFIELLVESDVVSGTICESVYKDGATVFDPIGLSEVFGDADEAEFREAVQSYYDAHKTESDVEKKLIAVGAFMAVEIEIVK